MQTDTHAEMLGNRLVKNARHRRKWARRRGISCYRLYDRDIPEVPLAIDWYEGRVQISHYDGGEDALWRGRMAAEIAARLEIAPEAVAVKERRRQRGDSQYQKLAASGRRLAVSEGGHRFWINLEDYLDAGLFLDHRQTRAMVAAEAADRRFLNLFAYTGSFSIYAAAAGAASTTTVDLSRTYSAWAADNFALNNVPVGERHRVVCADVFAFLGEAAAAGERYQLAVVDPPIFSNSKKTDRVLDVQRDHLELLERLARVLEPGAAVYFSSSRRKFRLAAGELEALGYRLREITGETVPEDFRQRRPHRAWRLVWR
jgi:23S rRNA G2069 N7-methylase RlmK/C1962 C5-methylase RlmI